MYTQKELLKNALTLDTKAARLLFITNWLEDINWHSENALFRQRNIDKHTEAFLEDMQWLFMAMNPNDYCKAFIDDHREDLQPYVDAYVASRKHNRGSISLPCGRAIGESTLYDFKQAQKGFSQFSRFTGWGLSEGWDHTSGIEFVEELEALLASFEEDDKERERVHAAYAQAYSD